MKCYLITSLLDLSLLQCLTVARKRERNAYNLEAVEFSTHKRSVEF